VCFFRFAQLLVLDDLSQSPNLKVAIGMELESLAEQLV